MPEVISLEDILKKTTVDFLFITELAQGLAGNEEYRTKYSAAFQGIDFNDTLMRTYHVDIKNLKKRFIVDGEKAIYGQIEVKTGGMIGKQVIDISYSRGMGDPWSFKKVNNNDEFVKTLYNLIIKYESLPK